MPPGRTTPKYLSQTRAITWFGLVTLVCLLTPSTAQAAGASLKISPSAGIYEVGGLVDVSFIVDTGGDSVNAIQTDVTFPPDKLQVVNPVASTSFISLWVTAPTYSNTDGTLHFQGGLPSPGVKTSGGVISTVTFRIKAPGTATIKFSPTSRVLKNDGVGTNILTSTVGAEYTLTVPPPAGPVVTSPTHPDINIWYNNNQVQYQWEAVPGAVGYSYLFDQSPKSVPDDTVRTQATSAVVTASGDGVWYFHVHAKTDSWGGVTSVPVQIDTTAPAKFAPSFDKATMTVEDVPTLRFVTSDAASGIDHYEVKQVTLSSGASPASTLFVETASPYTIGKLPAGSYEFIVRAFDRAGNSSDGTTKLAVVAGGLPFWATVPILQNPAIANGALVGLGLAVLILIIWIVLRRIRRPDTFQHDLLALERDAMKKSQALEKELEELRQAQQLVAQGVGSMPVSAAQRVAMPSTVTPPLVLPTQAPTSPMTAIAPPPPFVGPTPPPLPSPTSPYRYQPPAPLPPT